MREPMSVAVNPIGAAANRGVCEVRHASETMADGSAVIVAHHVSVESNQTGGWSIPARAIHSGYSGQVELWTTGGPLHVGSSKRAFRGELYMDGRTKRVRLTSGCLL